MQSKDRLVRGKLEIRAAILRAIRDGPNGKEVITKIASKANLKGYYARLDSEIADLLERGLVESAESVTRNIIAHVDSPERIGSQHPVYSLTDKGSICLESYDLLVNEMFGTSHVIISEQPSEWFKSFLRQR